MPSMAEDEHTALNRPDLRSSVFRRKGFTFLRELRFIKNNIPYLYRKEAFKNHTLIIKNSMTEPILQQLKPIPIKDRMDEYLKKVFAEDKR